MTSHTAESVSQIWTSEPDSRRTSCEEETHRFRIRYGSEMYMEGSVRGLGSILSMDSREFTTED